MTRKLFWFVLLAMALFAVDAAAYGNYRMRSTEAQESGGQWHLYLRIDLPNAPSLPHLPVKFMFTELTEYERALTDNSKDPVINRIPMQNQLPKVESLDVDFADATGKIFKTTNYDFSLTRARGYEAGEWKMQLRTADGQDIGTAQTITLHGDNPVVDRRSISFATKPKEAKKDAGTEVAQNDTAPTSTDVAAVGTPPPFVPPEGFQKTDEEQIKTKPGGCGCDVPGEAQSSLAILASTAALVALALHRRKKRA
jgi:MYXO-CTERM domain-containing protein